jgi:hypothetical protein
VPLEDGVERAEYVPHPALAEERLDAVSTDGVVRPDGHLGRIGETCSDSKIRP